MSDKKKNLELTPYRENSAITVVSPRKPVEVPSVSDKRALLDSIAASGNGDTIDPEMHEKRFQMIQEDIIESMDHIIQRTTKSENDWYYFKVPYLRTELVDGGINCENVRNERKRIKQRLIELFLHKGWDLYCYDFSISPFQPLDLWFWQSTRTVKLWSIITIKAI